MAQVRVIRVDSKARKVDLSQRSEEERASDKKLAEKGAGTIKVSGMNTLQAALARAGIQKADFEDLSKVHMHALLPSLLLHCLFRKPYMLNVTRRTYVPC